MNSVCGGRVGGIAGILSSVVPVATSNGLAWADEVWSGVEVPDFSALLYSMILKIFFGSLLEVMIVVTPAAVAISAAISFVSIPPVPRLEPSVFVLT